VRARGIDPGATIGWCDVECVSAGVFRYVASGTWEASRFEPCTRGGGIPELGAIEIVCVETPKEMHPNEVRAQLAHPATLVQTIRSLITTAALAERLAAEADGMCRRVMQPTAAEVRHELGVRLGGQRGRGPKLTVDQQIAKIIPLAIRGWPTRSNTHVRDAAAAALWALQQAELGEAIRRAPHEAARGFTIPPPGTYGPGDYGPDSFGGSDFG